MRLTRVEGNRNFQLTENEIRIEHATWACSAANGFPGRVGNRNGNKIEEPCNLEWRQTRMLTTSYLFVDFIHVQNMYIGSDFELAEKDVKEVGSRRHNVAMLNRVENIKIFKTIRI